MAVSIINLKIDGFSKPVTLRRLTGREEISACFEYDLVVEIHPDHVAEFNPLGSPATLEFLRDPSDKSPIHSVHGKVGGFTQITDMTLSEKEARFTVKVVPDLWFTGLAAKTKIFTKMTLPQIIDDRLGAANINFKRDKLEGTLYQERPLTCQYKETDLAFIERLMEDRGVYYYFDHTDHGKLIIADSAIYYGALLASDETLELEPGTWARNVRMAPKRVKLGGYDFRTPSYQIFGEAEFESCTGFDVHINDEPLRDQDEANALAQIRLEQVRRLSDHVVFRSFNCRLNPGMQFSRRDTDHVVTQASHYYVHEDASKSKETNQYRNSVTAIRSEIDYRTDLRRERPRVTGTEIGHIRGEKKEKALVDEEGLYKVELNYVSDPSDPHVTGLRMQQPAAGSHDGFYFPLKDGVEVVIAFAKGNPDLPYIHGAMSHGEYVSHVNHENSHQSVIMARELLLLKAGAGTHNSFTSKEYDPGKSVYSLEGKEDHTFEKLGVDGTSAGVMSKKEEHSGDFHIDRRYGHKYSFVNGCDFNWDNLATFNFGNDYIESHEKSDAVTDDEVFDLNSRMSGLASAWDERKNGLVEKTWGDRATYHKGRAIHWGGGEGPGESLQTYNYGPRYTENLVEDEKGTSTDKGGMHDAGAGKIGSAALIEKTFGDTYSYQSGKVVTVHEGDVDHEHHGNITEVVEGDTEFTRTGKCKVTQDGDAESEYMTNVKTTTHGDIEESTEGKVTSTIEGKIAQTYNGGRETTEAAAAKHTYKAALTVKQFSLDEKTDTNKTETITGTHKVECAVSQEKAKSMKTLEAPMLQLKGNLATVKHSLIMLG